MTAEGSSLELPKERLVESLGEAPAVIAEEHGAELGECVGRVFECGEQYGAFGDSEREDFDLVCDGAVEPVSEVAGAVVPQDPGELHDFGVGDGAAGEHHACELTPVGYRSLRFLLIRQLFLILGVNGPTIGARVTAPMNSPTKPDGRPEFRHGTRRVDQPQEDAVGDFNDELPVAASADRRIEPGRLEAHLLPHLVVVPRRVTKDSIAYELAEDVVCPVGRREDNLDVNLLTQAVVQPAQRLSVRHGASRDGTFGDGRVGDGKAGEHHQGEAT